MLTLEQLDEIVIRPRFSGVHKSLPLLHDIGRGGNSIDLQCDSFDSYGWESSLYFTAQSTAFGHSPTGYPVNPYQIPKACRIDKLTDRL